MKFVFQTIVYRLFRSERFSKMNVVDYKNAIDMISFNRQESAVVGLLMQNALLRTSLNAPMAGGFEGSIYD